MITLTHEMIYRLKMVGPLPTTKGAPVGEREYWEMSDGELMGDRIRAKIVKPGGDWMLIGSDGLWRPDVRAQFRTDDGAIVLLHYTGLVKPNPKFAAAAQAGHETKFEDQYLRQFMHFEAGSEKYRWLNQELFVAEGRLTGPAQIEYYIYRLG
jgi:hypothetical protein